MVKTADVVAGADILTNWGNEIRDKTAQVFASAVERDNQWPAPADGALAYTTDLGALWLRRAGAWVATVGTGQPPYTGTGIANYTDAHGELWVAKSTVAGGAWKRARDVLICQVARTAAFTVSNAITPIPWDTVETDLYGLWAAPNFVAPVPGIYTASATLSLTPTVAGFLYVYHALKSPLFVVSSGGGSGSFSTSLRLAAGQTFQSSGNSQPAAAPLAGGAAFNFASFRYVGTG